MNTLSRDGGSLPPPQHRHPPVAFLNLSISEASSSPCAMTRKVVLFVSMGANYFPYRPCPPEWMCASPVCPSVDTVFTHFRWDGAGSFF